LEISRMGLISGAASFTRYRVDGALPPDFMEELSGRIARYAFRNLDEDSPQERSAGWVNIMDVLDNRFSGMEYLKEPYIAMSFRVDTRKIPRTALKHHCRVAEEKIREQEQRAFLSGTARREIKEMVRDRLMRRAIPVTRTYDMIWDFTRGTVIFGCVNNKLCDAFAELFFKTFGLQLQAVFPYVLAVRILEKDGAATDALDGLLRIPGFTARGGSLFIRHSIRRGRTRVVFPSSWGGRCF